MKIWQKSKVDIFVFDGEGGGGVKQLSEGGIVGELGSH